MYAVIHGGVDPALRRASCDLLSKHPFDGYAIGGSMGKTRDQMLSMLSSLTPHLPHDKPNHLLGIADLPSLEACIPIGLDTFDSSYPTKAARHGTLLTKKGNIKITKRFYATEYGPIEEDCPCSTCKHYSLAYLNHLFKAKELLALSLASIHNLFFMVSLMKDYQNKILSGKL